MTGWWVFVECVEEDEDSHAFVGPLLTRDDAEDHVESIQVMEMEGIGTTVMDDAAKADMLHHLEEIGDSWKQLWVVDDEEISYRRFFNDDVEWLVLDRQKQALVALLEEREDADLAGLLEMIEALQDRAADVLGRDAVYDEG